MNTVIALGKSKNEICSNPKGKCIHFGKIHCIHKKKISEQKILSTEKRCKGRRIKCKFFIGKNSFVPDFDTNYVFSEKETETLAMAIQHGDNILLSGIPGGGKTSLVKQIASILNWGLIQFSCSEETSSAKLLGEWVVIGKDMKWSDGLITTAMKCGYILLEDEADFMRPELRGELHSIMEENGSVTLSAIHPDTQQPFQKVITKHPLFRWVSTANTIGLGDDLFQYHGTQYFNSAARDRYAIILQFKYKTPQEELMILEKKTGIEQITAIEMIKIANACRAEENKDINFQFTLRRLMSWAKYWTRMNAETASEVSILNFCSDSDRYFIKSLIRTHLNVEVEQ